MKRAIDFQIASNYSQALFDIAKKRDKLKIIKEQLDAISLSVIQNLPYIKKAPKVFKDAIDKSNLEVMLKNCFYIIISNNKLNLFEEVYKKYCLFFNNYYNHKNVRLTFAYMPHTKQKDSLLRLIKDKLKIDIIAQVCIDPMLIDGAIIDIDNSIQIKASYKDMVNQIQQHRHKMIKVVTKAIEKQVHKTFLENAS